MSRNRLNPYSLRSHHMKRIVYIETSIPSFYHEVRAEPEMVSRKEWTRRWWDECRHDYILATSEAVMEELRQGDYPNKEQSLALMKDIPLIPTGPAIAEIVQSYVNHKLMPKKPLNDAFHLASASFHKCDFLLTWNCNHLANANKFRHIHRINTMLELYTPILTTPFQLLGENDDD